MTEELDFHATRRVLDAEVAEGLSTKGAQVAIWREGAPLLSCAVGDDGRGQPMAVDTVLRVYCTIKPVTAVAVARLVDQGELDLDAPLREHVEGFQVLDDGKVTTRTVLDHTAGLHRPKALEVELLDPRHRASRLATAERPPGWQVGAAAGYSEWFGWHLLGLLLEGVTGEPLHDVLRAWVLDPLGMQDTWVGMTADEHRELLPRLGLNHDMRSLQSFPLLLERGVRMCTEVNAAHGGYSTADDLARFYAGLLERRAGGGPDDLPSPATIEAFTTSSRPPLDDVVMGRPCTYGLGFMTDLEQHEFGPRPSPASFGHSGNVGSSFAFADPARSLAVGVVYNGIVDHESAFLRRPALVRAIFADLDALDEALDDTTSLAEAPAPTRSRWRRRR